MYHSRVVVPVIVAVAGLLLWGCSSPPDFVAKPEPWREDDESACLAAGVVREQPFVDRDRPLAGRALCGAASHSRWQAASGGRIQLNPPRCCAAP